MPDLVLARIRLMPRPTRATALLLTIAAILELLGQLINSTGVTIAAAAAVGAVMGDAFLAPSVTYAEVERHTPARMAVGVEAPVRLDVRGAAKRASGRRPVVLTDRAPGLDIGRYVIPSLRRGEHAVAERTAMPHHRGCWSDGGRVDVEAYSPLGGWVRRNRVLIAESGWIYPSPAAPLRLPEGAAGEVYGRNAASRSGAGHDFYGIREWRTGDATTSVHWRASARRNQLVVMERERPGHPPLVVIAGPLADTDAAEDLLARVAATAVKVLLDGRTVVLAAAGSAVSVARPTDALDWFAGLAPAVDPDAATLRTAMRLGGFGATVVWLGGGQLPPPVASAVAGAGAGTVTAAASLVAGVKR